MCVAAPGRIVSIEPGEGLSIPAKVSFAGGTVKEVDLVMVPHAQVGNYVVVHSGFAVSVVNAAAARESIELFGEAEAKELTRD